MTSKEYINQTKCDVLLDGTRHKGTLSDQIKLIQVKLRHAPFTCEPGHFGIVVRNKRAASALVFESGFSPSFLQAVLNQV